MKFKSIFFVIAIFASMISGSAAAALLTIVPSTLSLTGKPGELLTINAVYFRKHIAITN